MSKLTHLNAAGEAHMVDISEKPVTARSATAQSQIVLTAEVVAAINDDSLPKGDLYATARIAGIQAAKKCSELIPLCHPLMLTSINMALDLDMQQNSVLINATCKVNGQTGVEMEALTAVSVAALTIYDMCKAVDKNMVIEGICLDEKLGGKSGHYQRSESA